MWSCADVVAGAQLFDDVAVDLHAAFEDDLFGLAAAGDAGLRENLLEAIALRSFLWLVRWICVVIFLAF